MAAGSAITAFTPVTAAGGFGAVTLAVSPALPAGLSFNTTTGQITGTPTALLATTTFTVTATDSTTPTAQTSSKTFSLAVTTPPQTTTQAVATTSVVAGGPVIAFTPVTVAGGFGTVTLAVSPALPTGLSFNTATRPDHRHADGAARGDNLHRDDDRPDDTDGANVLEDVQPRGQSGGTDDHVVGHLLQRAPGLS